MAKSMNKLTLCGMLLAGGTIAFDHLAGPLPQTAAIILYTAAVMMFIAGFIKGRKNA